MNTNKQGEDILTLIFSVLVYMKQRRAMASVDPDSQHKESKICHVVQML